MRISASVKISCSTLLKGSLILSSPFELHLEQVPYPRGWRESKELVLFLSTSSFIETCLVYSPKPEHPWKEVGLERPHLPQGCAAGTFLLQTCVFIFRALLCPPYSHSLPLQLANWHQPNGENSVIFSCSKSNRCL